MLNTEVLFISSLDLEVILMDELLNMIKGKLKASYLILYITLDAFIVARDDQAWLWVVDAIV